MRLPTPEHIAILTDPQTWTDNPFAARAERRDLRRKQLARHCLGLALVLIPILALALCGLNWLRTSGYGLPWYLGDEVGGTLCIFIAGFHVWFIIAERQRHTGTLFAQEAYRNTLPGLLMLPDPPFRLLVQTVGYPWLSAMRIALLGLPLYVLCVGLQGVSWSDVLMLYLVYALLALGVPVWRRPARGDNPILVLPSQPAQGQNNMGAQQAIQAAQMANSGSGSLGLVGGICAGFAMFMLVLSRTLTQSDPMTLYDAVHPYLPDPILWLLPGVFLSWPLLLGRALLTPFHWYGVTLIPALWFPAVTLLGQYLQALRTAEFLSVGTFRDLVEQPTYAPRRRLEGTLRWTLMFIMLGYLWPWAVRNGGVALFAPGRNRLSVGDAGQQGLLYIALLMTYLRLILRVDAMERMAVERRKGTAILALPLARTVRFVCEPVLSLCCLYVAGCLLSGMSPFVPAVAALAGKMLALMAVGAWLYAGLRRAASPLLHVTLFLALVTALIAGGPRMRPLAIFSPLLALLGLGNADLYGGLALHSPPFPPWQPTLAGAAAIALLFWLVSEIVSRLRRTAVAVNSDVRNALDPTQIGPEVFLDGTTRPDKGDRNAETALGTQLAQWVTRYWDNAVFTKELRVRLRRTTWKVIVAPLVFYAVATLAMLLYPPVSVQFGGLLARLVFGRVIPLPVRGVLGIACFGYLLLCPLLLATVAIGATVFSVDRDKSTLGFVLLTPLSARSIAFGKIAGALLPATLACTSLVIWTLLLSLLATPQMGLVPVMVWAQVVFTILLMWLAGNLAVMALAAMFPRPMKGCVLAGILLPQIFVQVMLYLLRQGLARRRAGRPRLRGGPHLHLPWHLNGTALWLIFLGACLMIIVVATLVMIWGVRRMRKRDMVFAASKREN